MIEQMIAIAMEIKMTDSIEKKVKEYNYSNDFKVATQLKSWMAINPSYGCIWDCVYCIQHKDKFFDTSEYRKVNKVKNAFGEEITPDEVVAEIMTNPRITSKTPLALYNFSDPFLPQNKADLLSILTKLDSREFTNPVGLITRTFADNEIVETISQLKYLRPVILVSYAGYNNKKIESAPEGKRLEMMKKFKDKDVPVLQYLRPLVEEWMEPDQLERASKNVEGIIDGVVMSGLRLTPEIIAKIASRELPIPKVSNYENKFFPEKLQSAVLQAYKNIAPVFRYTSCAVSAVLNIPDYNAHFQYLKENRDLDLCDIPCKSGQPQICASCPSTNYDRVRTLLDRIDQKDASFKINPKGIIYVDKKLVQVDKTFIRHNTSRHVECVNEKDNHIDQIVYNNKGKND